MLRTRISLDCRFATAWGGFRSLRRIPKLPQFHLSRPIESLQRQACTAEDGLLRVIRCGDDGQSPFLAITISFSRQKARF